MAFRRYKGFFGSMPQRFIDDNLPICPICGEEAKWTLEQKFIISGVRYRYKCTACNAIISLARKDIFKMQNNEVLILKPASKRKEFIPPVGVEKLGKIKDTELKEGYQYNLKDMQLLSKKVKRVVLP